MEGNTVVDHASIVRGAAVAVLSLRQRLLLLATCCAVLAIHGAYQWSQLHHASKLPYRGVARLIDDPIKRFGGVQVVLLIEGKRYVSVAHSVAGRRLARGEAGNTVVVSGTRNALNKSLRLRYASRHVVGEFIVDRVEEQIFPSSPLYRSANNLRAVTQGAANVMPQPVAALFMGLVIGDDRGQSRTMVNSFRNSGLSHLTAVSGQNVAFVLAVFGTLINRTRTWWRLGLTLLVLCWFVVLTRAEPSVLRAAAMAGLSAVSFARGRELSARGALAYSVVLLLALDPLLITSIGFWMSSLATLGLVFITPLLKQHLRGPSWCINPLATTLGAQVGVLPFSLLLFSSAPAISLVTNLLAVPVAGAVMLMGLPMAWVCGLLISLCGSVVLPLCEVVMFPVQCATQWVWWVAVVGERVSPHGTANVVLWLLWACFLAVIHRSARIFA